MSNDLSERTKKYVDALVRLGPNFDFDGWLAEVRAEKGKLNGSGTSPEASGTSAGSTGGPLGRHEPDVEAHVEPKEAVSQSVWSTVRSTAPTSKPLWRFKPISPKPRDVVAEELSTVEKAFTAFQSSRRRDSVYSFLRAVYDLVQDWKRRGKCRSRTARIAAKCGFPPKDRDPYAIIIQASADVDAKTRSKWSRALRYVEEANVHHEYLRGFMKRNGGINDCAVAFKRRRRRARRDR